MKTLVEAIAAIILIPLIIAYRLVALVLIIGLLASPLILIGFLIWAVAR